MNLTHLIKTLRDKMFKYVTDTHSVGCQSFEGAFILTCILRGFYSRRGVCLRDLLSGNFRTYESVDLRRRVKLNRAFIQEDTVLHLLNMSFTQ